MTDPTDPNDATRNEQRHAVPERSEREAAPVAGELVQHVPGAHDNVTLYVCDKDEIASATPGQCIRCESELERRDYVAWNELEGALTDLAALLPACLVSAEAVAVLQVAPSVPPFEYSFNYRQLSAGVLHEGGCWQAGAYDSVTHWNRAWQLGCD